MEALYGRLQTQSKYSDEYFKTMEKFNLSTNDDGYVRSQHGGSISTASRKSENNREGVWEESRKNRREKSGNSIELGETSRIKYSKSLDNKTFENPDWYKKHLEKERPSWIKDYEYKVIDIERLVKDKDLGYHGIHSILNVDNIPVEIQLYTKKSWETKLAQDKIYDKWRNVPKEIQSLERENDIKSSIKLGNQLLEDEEFNLLRTSCFVILSASIIEPISIGFGSTHLPSTSSRNGVPPSLTSNTLPNSVSTNLFINPSSLSNNSISQEKEDLKPYETNKAKEIKESAQEVLDNISYREYLISNGVNIKESINQSLKYIEIMH